jgi:hypothetical protein
LFGHRNPAHGIIPFHPDVGIWHRPTFADFV